MITQEIKRSPYSRRAHDATCRRHGSDTMAAQPSSPLANPSKNLAPVLPMARGYLFDGIRANLAPFREREFLFVGARFTDPAHSTFVRATSHNGCAGSSPRYGAIRLAAVFLIRGARMAFTILALVASTNFLRGGRLGACLCVRYSIMP